MTVFAVWRREGRALEEPLGSRVKSLLEGNGGAQFDGAFGAVKVWPPASLRREGSAATAWAASHRGSEAPSGHPTVRLDGFALTITAGPLPQYPLYYSRGPNDDYVLVSSNLEGLARLLPHMPLSTQRLLSYLL